MLKAITTILALSGEHPEISCKEAVKKLSFEVQMMIKENEEQVEKTEALLEKLKKDKLN